MARYIYVPQERARELVAEVRQFIIDAQTHHQDVALRLRMAPSELSTFLSADRRLTRERFARIRTALDEAKKEVAANADVRRP